MPRAYSAILQPRAVALLALAASAIAFAGCGSNESGAEVEAPRESAQPVPELPVGWRVDRNDAGGFAVGVPPGWAATADGAQAELRSQDGLVVITITPDRTDELIEADLEELAESTGVRYGEQFVDFRLGRAGPFRHAYRGYSVTAEGKRDGVGQQLELIFLRRGRIVTFTVIVQRNESFGTRAYGPTIDRVVRSIRSRPVG